ncbi:NAD(P)-dependent oxidoreductase [Agathobaculum desmolans]|uniref:NAD-dependent epimerase/dehydratase family protein n=1 Tax=Agathobaculum desmolans TaxID=39484 RepID=UPI0029425156|nr:NAD(P)-dependent oxidoreductase [Agathobaculum desmolans]
MTHAIVTGANGFIGSAVVKELLRNDVQVCAVVHNGHSDNLPDASNLHIVSYDLAEMSQLPAKLPLSDYDIFYHLAWAGSAGSERANTSLQLQNAQWTVEALQAAKEVGCQRFICAGSIMEHETIAAAYTQGNKPGLGYIYGGGKVIAHIMCMSVAAKIGIELIWPEITNAYGVGERSPRLVNTTIQKCIHGESPQFTAGTQNYDFVYIDDVARAFYLIGKNGKSFHEYLIGSSSARPLREFLTEMQEAIAPELEFKFGDIPFTGVDLPLSRFDCSETEKDTGFRAEVSFAEGCRRTAAWWKKLEA